MQTNTAKTEKLNELGRLRNRHVAKLLDFIGESPPYLENAIKKQFSMFAEDVEDNIINSDNRPIKNDISNGRNA